MVELHVDRDNVAMGDDVKSHARIQHVATGTLLSEALAECAPEIRIPGW